MKKIFSVTVLSLLTVVLFSQGTLQIEVEDLKNNDGQLILLLFKKGNDFGIDETPFRKIKCSNLSNNEASFSINDVTEGEYAFLIYHDEDNNEKCKTNWIGMPREGVGKSGDSGNRPSYSNSKFSFYGDIKTFNIKIKHL